MGTETLATRIQAVSGSLDGIEAIIMGLVDGTDDLDVQRIAFTVGDHLRRLSTDLDSIAHEMPSKEAG